MSSWQNHVFLFIFICLCATTVYSMLQLSEMKQIQDVSVRQSREMMEQATRDIVESNNTRDPYDMIDSALRAKTSLNHLVVQFNGVSRAARALGVKESYFTKLIDESDQRVNTSRNMLINALREQDPSYEPHPLYVEQ